MQRFILIRFIQAILTGFAVLTVVFVLSRFTGDPIERLVSQRARPEARERLRKKLGLDKPVMTQYGNYLKNVFSGEFGDSFVYRRPVTDLVLKRIRLTIQLMGTALLFSIIIAVPIGVYSAAKRGSILDISGRAWAFLGMSAPPFWVGLMLIYFFAVKYPLFPIGGRGGIQHLVLPAFTLGWAFAAGIVRITRSSMLNVLNSDYITMARAKGVSNTLVTWKHGFKNGAIPVVTFIMLLMIFMLGGAVVTENIFAWPGMGRLLMDSVLNRDFPVVQAIVIFISLSFVILNLIADIIYAYLDPKIRYR